MSVINEEIEDRNQIFHNDFSELLDLPESAFAGSEDVLATTTLGDEALLAPCPAHETTK